MSEIDEKKLDRRSVGRPSKQYTEDERPEQRHVTMPHRLWLLLPESAERNKVIANLVEIAYGDFSMKLDGIDREIKFLSDNLEETTKVWRDSIEALVKQKENILRAKAKIDEAKQKGVI